MDLQDNILINMSNLTNNDYEAVSIMNPNSLSLSQAL